MDTKMPLNQSIETLNEILLSIDETLAWIVLDSGLIRNGFQPMFESLWDSTHARIEGAIRQLEELDSEENDLYRALEEHGLTNESLELKMAIGRDITRSVVASAEEDRDGVPRIIGFALKPLVKWINLILGSLSKVLPILAAVKEYKEGVELTIEHKRTAPVWDPRILKI